MALMPPEPCPRRPVFQLGRWWHSSIRVPWLQPAIIGYGLGHHVGRARPWRDAGGRPWPCPSARWRAPARAARPRPRTGVAGINAGTRRGRTPAGLGSGEGAGAQRGRADRAPPSAGAACPGSWRGAGASAPDAARTRSVRVCESPARWAPARGAGSAVLRREHGQPDPSASAHARCSAVQHGATRRGQGASRRGSADPWLRHGWPLRRSVRASLPLRRVVDGSWHEDRRGWRCL